MTALMVIIGAAIGAPARYLTDRAISARRDSVFPLGTLTINVIGSFILGLIFGVGLHGIAFALIGTGFCGALTTYSTFGYETVRLMHERAYQYALGNVVANLALGCGAAFAGYAIGIAL